MASRFTFRDPLADERRLRGSCGRVGLGPA
ncbi:hypothetical protein P3T27_007981 [Kitasatospora sp. MAA19]|nr:hypothetical protein [Kitasatospora sp. MAA19]